LVEPTPLKNDENVENQQFLKKVKNTMTKVNGYYQLELPWKSVDVTLPYNILVHNLFNVVTHEKPDGLSITLSKNKTNYSLHSINSNAKMTSQFARRYS